MMHTNLNFYFISKYGDSRFSKVLKYPATKARRPKAHTFLLFLFYYFYFFRAGVTSIRFPILLLRWIRWGYGVIIMAQTAA